MESVLKKFYLCIFLFFAVAIGVSLLFNRLVWSDLTKPLMEGVLFFGVILIAVSRQRFRQFLIDLPAIHQSILGIFMFLMILSQLINFSSTTFPFVNWSMYGGVNRSHLVENFTYWGLDDQGNKTVIIPARLFPAVGNRLIVGMEARLSGIRNYKEPEDEWRTFTSIFTPIRLFMLHEPVLSLEQEKEQLNKILAAVGKKYNKENQGRAVVAVEIHRKTMDLVSGQWSPAETVWQVKLEGEEPGP